MRKAWRDEEDGEDEDDDDDVSVSCLQLLESF